MGKDSLTNFIVILMGTELKLMKGNYLFKSIERLRNKIKIKDNFKFAIAYSYRRSSLSTT